MMHTNANTFSKMNLRPSSCHPPPNDETLHDRFLNKCWVLGVVFQAKYLDRYAIIRHSIGIGRNTFALTQYSERVYGELHGEWEVTQISTLFSDVSVFQNYTVLSWLLFVSVWFTLVCVFLELVGWFGVVGYFFLAVGQFCICPVVCWPILYLFRWVVAQMATSQNGLDFQQCWPTNFLGRPTDFSGGPNFSGRPTVPFLLEVLARFWEVTLGSVVKMLKPSGLWSVPQIITSKNVSDFQNIWRQHANS